MTSGLKIALAVITTVATAVGTTIAVLSYIDSRKAEETKVAESGSIVGRWKGEDKEDGSIVTVEITQVHGAEYQIIVTDSSSSLCGGAKNTYVQTGTLSGLVLKGSNTITCPDNPVKPRGPFPFEYRYDPASDQIHDLDTGVLTRLRTPL